MATRLGSYYLERKIGEGGFGEVWKGFLNYYEHEKILKLLHKENLPGELGELVQTLKSMAENAGKTFGDFLKDTGEEFRDYPIEKKEEDYAILRSAVMEYFELRRKEVQQAWQGSGIESILNKDYLARLEDDENAGEAAKMYNISIKALKLYPGDENIKAKMMFKAVGIYDALEHSHAEGRDDLISLVESYGLKEKIAEFEEAYDIMMILLPETVIRAMKYLTPKSTDDMQQIENRFRTEMSLRVIHPNIIPITDSGMQTVRYGSEGYGSIVLNMLYLAMEFSEDKNLEDKVLGEKEAIPTILGILRGLMYFHATEEKLHRDVKPSNMIGDRICDFNIAKSVHEEQNFQRTATGTTVGTMFHQDPERDWKESTERSDLYGLGMSLYKILTGRYPFRAKIQVQMYAFMSQPQLWAWPREMPIMTEEPAIKVPSPGSIETIVTQFQGNDAAIVSKILGKTRTQNTTAVDQEELERVMRALLTTTHEASDRISGIEEALNKKAAEKEHMNSIVPTMSFLLERTIMGTIECEHDIRCSTYDIEYLWQHMIDTDTLDSEGERRYWEQNPPDMTLINILEKDLPELQAKLAEKVMQLEEMTGKKDEQLKKEEEEDNKPKQSRRTFFGLRKPKEANPEEKSGEQRPSEIIHIEMIRLQEEVSQLKAEMEDYSTMISEMGGKLAMAEAYYNYGRSIMPGVVHNPENIEFEERVQRLGGVIAESLRRKDMLEKAVMHYEQWLADQDFEFEPETQKGKPMLDRPVDYGAFPELTPKNVVDRTRLIGRLISLEQRFMARQEELKQNPESELKIK